jgi:hypothetical protein
MSKNSHAPEMRREAMHIQDCLTDYILNFRANGGDRNPSASDVSYNVGGLCLLISAVARRLAEGYGDARALGFLNMLDSIVEPMAIAAISGSSAEDG